MKSSNEASCTMVVGKDAPLGPTGLRATRIRTNSATIIWLPSNTNFLHTLCLNNVEVRTVKQGVFKHTIAGLTPNTIYKVTVRAKNIKATCASTGGTLDTFFGRCVQPRPEPVATRAGKADADASANTEVARSQI